MDSLDLLAREDEFKKLNKQLEKKTESLMKEIEQAMVGFVVAIFFPLLHIKLKQERVNISRNSIIYS